VLVSVPAVGLGYRGGEVRVNIPTERLPTMAIFRCLASVVGIYTVCRRDGISVGWLYEGFVSTVATRCDETKRKLGGLGESRWEKRALVGKNESTRNPDQPN
jgi:hypothetical protein